MSASLPSICRHPIRHSLGLAMALLLAVPPALALDDHEAARAALQAGEVQPLTVILERVARDLPGQVLEVELEREGGRWLYELKVLQAGGSMVKVRVDARSAEVLRPRGRH